MTSLPWLFGLVIRVRQIVAENDEAERRRLLDELGLLLASVEGQRHIAEATLCLAPRLGIEVKKKFTAGAIYFHLIETLKIEPKRARDLLRIVDSTPTNFKKLRGKELPTNATRDDILAVACERGREVYEDLECVVENELESRRATKVAKEQP